jgi:hypothetical protein
MNNILRIVILMVVLLASCSSGRYCISESDKKQAHRFSRTHYVNYSKCPSPVKKYHKWLFVFNAK